MQGLADGYFVLPYTVQNYLADQIKIPQFKTSLPEFDEAEKNINDQLNLLYSIKGNSSVDSFHRRLGKIMWDYVGMARNAEGLKKAIVMIGELRKEFYKDLKITGIMNGVNAELEKAYRLADFLELGELMAKDALQREESCGGHFREEYQTPEGEALRDDEKFMYVAAWDYAGGDFKMHKESLQYESIEIKQRSYK